MAMLFCSACGKEIHESAQACPQCGALQASKNNPNHVSNDARLSLLAEFKKKSGWIAAFLNLLFAGAGYMYCGRVILGIFVFILTVIIASTTFGIGLLIIAPILFIDGFLAAGRYNKKMMAELIEKTA